MYKILTNDDYRMSTWSGGTTTEILLDPPQGNYQERDFNFRISTATVDLPESEFSPLEGFKRIIMPLEGQMTLTHTSQNDQAEVVELATFETDYFEGGDLTHSVGKCTDFNLIYKPHYSGTMNALEGGEERSLFAGETYIFYALQDVELNLMPEWDQDSQGETLHLEKGQSLYVTDLEDTYLLSLQGQENQVVTIEVCVYLND
ncbi:HutD family protein [Vaginisenegalia massiliensis]|uniref:HutD/Ves family protein n=1 Tax=Vaginisenegalia massiliensis TaxID=2058294 RepID=UPI000F546030|nr:HutD family protein [Vaginisenegalia massiliensis]